MVETEDRELHRSSNNHSWGEEVEASEEQNGNGQNVFDVDGDDHDFQTVVRNKKKSNNSTGNGGYRERGRDRYRGGYGGYGRQPRSGEDRDREFDRNSSHNFRRKPFRERDTNNKEKDRKQNDKDCDDSCKNSTVGSVSSSQPEEAQDPTVIIIMPAPPPSVNPWQKNKNAVSVITGKKEEEKTQTQAQTVKKLAKVMPPLPPMPKAKKANSEVSSTSRISSSAHLSSTVSVSSGLSSPTLSSSSQSEDAAVRSNNNIDFLPKKELTTGESVTVNPWHNRRRLSSVIAAKHGINNGESLAGDTESFPPLGENTANNAIKKDALVTDQSSSNGKEVVSSNTNNPSKGFHSNAKVPNKPQLQLLSDLISPSWSKELGSRGGRKSNGADIQKNGSFGDKGAEKENREGFRNGDKKGSYSSGGVKKMHDSRDYAAQEKGYGYPPRNRNRMTAPLKPRGVIPVNSRTRSVSLNSLSTGGHIPWPVGEGGDLPDSFHHAAYTTIPSLYPMTELVLPAYAGSDGSFFAYAAAPPHPAATPYVQDETLLMDMVRKQIEYYFSKENLEKDFFMRRKMDLEGWIPVNFIATFPRIRIMTNDFTLVVQAIQSSSELEMTEDTSPNPVYVRTRNNPQKWPIAPTNSVEFASASDLHTLGNGGEFPSNSISGGSCSSSSSSSSSFDTNNGTSLNPNVAEFVPKGIHTTVTA